jgi:hypothetical protein
MTYILPFVHVKYIKCFLIAVVIKFDNIYYTIIFIIWIDIG